MCSENVVRDLLRKAALTRYFIGGTVQRAGRPKYWKHQSRHILARHLLKTWGIERTMKKLCLTLFYLSLNTFPVHAGTINVSDYGDHSGVDYTGTAAAVAAASDGDTVQMTSGTASWSNYVAVAKGITIQGAGATSTVLTNSSTVVGGSTPPLFVLTDGGTNSIPRRMTGIGFKGALINSNFNKAGIAVADNGWYSQNESTTASSMIFIALFTPQTPLA